MTISNERSILPIVRNAVNGYSLQELIKVISAKFDEFISSEKERDKYSGWSFDIEFVSAHSSDYNEYPLLNSGLQYVPKTKEDCTIVVSGKGLINIHLHSFLCR